MANHIISTLVRDMAIHYLKTYKLLLEISLSNYQEGNDTNGMTKEEIDQAVTNIPITIASLDRTIESLTNSSDV